MFLVSINGLDLSVPEQSNEVRLDHFVPFNRCYQAFNKYIDDQQEANEKVEIKQCILLMADAVATYFKLDIEDIAGMPLGDFERTINSLGRSELNRIDKSLSMIFNALSLASTTYQPKKIDKDYEFNYKGQTFIISRVHQENYKGSLTVSESIEILEAQRIANLTKDKKGPDNVNFTQMLNMIAVLARQKGENFPLDQAEIDEMLRERIEFFKDITMDIGLDIAFFLTNFGETLGMTQIAHSILTHQNRK